MYAVHCYVPLGAQMKIFIGVAVFAPGAIVSVDEAPTCICPTQDDHDPLTDWWGDLQTSWGLKRNREGKMGIRGAVIENSCAKPMLKVKKGLF